ncbi:MULTISPECIES: WPE palindromic element domain-containing protein [Wolbachia]|nr:MULTISPECIES: WPE palindromic element domain-containing protein [Wolbachia]MDE5062584.1 WPE palindromic element domain-containing protein [Wolbachia endosymbiont of Drosophila tsacasi]
MPRHWDPEDVISTKWLHNKGWIPVPSAGMTPVALRHTAIHSRYLIR